MKPSVLRIASAFGVAVAINNVAQFVWVLAGAHVLGIASFGLVLTCQAIYGVLQVITDNGSLIHGARQAASDGLSPEDRSELVNTRVILGTGSGLTGLALVAIISPHLTATLVPFVIALIAFSLLNVWEPYGRGEAGAYACYLTLRSSVIAVIAVACLVFDLGFSPYLAGLCELIAVLITGFAFRAWALPSSLALPTRSTWRAIGEIGAPGLLTQATFASTTVIFGAAGNTAAAAISGVGTRLLTGLQGINGVVAAGLFPLIARGDARGDGRAARLVPTGIVTLSLAALTVACLLQSHLLEWVIGVRSPDGARALTLWIGGACASGYILHLSFAVMARRIERGLALLSLSALVVTVVATVSVSTASPGEATLVASSGFLLGQTLLLLLLAAHLRRHGHAEWVSPPLLALAVAAAGVAALAAFEPIAAAIAGLLALAGCAVLAYPLLRPDRSVTERDSGVPAAGYDAQPISYPAAGPASDASAPSDILDAPDTRDFSRGGFSTAAVILAVILVLTVNEFGRSRQSTTFASSEKPSPTTVAKLPTFRLGFDDESPVRFIASSAAPRSELLVVHLRKRMVRVSPVAGYGAVHPAFEQRFSARPSDVDTGPWDDANPAAMLVAVPGRTKTQLTVSILDPHAAGRALTDPTDLTLPPAPKRVERRLRLSRWDGPLGDLFVIDRDPVDRFVRVQIFSGESRFRDRLIDAKVRFGSFDAETYAVDVLPTRRGGRPDVIFTSTNRRLVSGTVDIHVLSGDEALRQFSLQTRTPFPATQNDLGPVLTVNEGGRLTLLAIERRAKLLRRVPAA